MRATNDLNRQGARDSNTKPSSVGYLRRGIFRTRHWPRIQVRLVRQDLTQPVWYTRPFATLLFPSWFRLASEPSVLVNHRRDHCQLVTLCDQRRKYVLLVALESLDPPESLYPFDPSWLGLRSP